MSEAEKIAAQLNQSQVDEVLSLSGEWLVRPHQRTVVWLRPAIAELATPPRLGTERIRLTPLGLEIRAILQRFPTTKSSGNVCR